MAKARRKRSRIKNVADRIDRRMDQLRKELEEMADVNP